MAFEDQKKLEILRPQYEQKESLLAQVKDLETVIEIIDKQLQLSKKMGSVERGLEKQKAKEEALVLLKNQKEQIENNNKIQNQRSSQI